MTKLIAYLGMVAVLAVQAKAEETSTKRTNFIQCGSKKLILVDAAASWNPKKRELNVYLSPYKLTVEDLKDVKRGGWWAPGSGKESPDQTLWGDTCPSTQVLIEFKQGDPSLKSADFCAFTFYHLAPQLSDSLNLTGKDILKNIQSLAVKGKTLNLQSKGSEELVGGTYTWDLSLSCPIYDVEEQ